MAEIPEDIQRLMDEADKKDILQAKSVVTFVTSLKSKISTNVEERYQHGDDPPKFMNSEMALHEALKQVKEIPVDTEMLKIFLSKTTGISDLIGLLVHRNPDIVSDALSALSDLTDPELVVPLAEADESLNEEAIVKDLLDKDILAYLADTVTNFAETQHTDENDFGNVTLGLQILENLLELHPVAVLKELRVNKTLIPFFLNQILHKEPFSYNKSFAMELLETIMQQSPSCAVWISSSGKDEVDLPSEFENDERYMEEKTLTHGLTGIKNFVNALAVYRKQPIETAEQEEFVSNAFLCIQIAFLTESSKKIFSENLGIQLMIRMIRERNKCLPQALRTLSMILNGSGQNCDLFVQQSGLKSISGVFMYKGVMTKAKGHDYLIDEYTTAVFDYLLRFGNGETNSRVCMKFAEQRGEKLIRLLDTITTYVAKVTKAPAQVAKEIEALQKISEIGEEADEDELSYDDRLYLRKCDLGYNALLNSIFIFLQLANSGNAIITKLLIGLQSTHNVHPLKTVAFYVEDYLSHLCESESLDAEKSRLRGLLMTYLSSYDDLLKTTYRSQYEEVLRQNENNPTESAEPSEVESTVVESSKNMPTVIVEEDDVDI